uniref:Uncharacterized protein n=1 Tax=Ditylenchus dipsaci TaxID=166011 RepID=A0A915EPF8_9BILA
MEAQNVLLQYLSLYSAVQKCRRRSLKNFIAGGIGGACKVAVGIPALYKGISVPMAMAVPLSAIFFGGCALGRFVSKMIEYSNILLEPSSWCYGRVLCKSNMCYEIRGPFEVLVKLFKEGGVKNLYQAFPSLDWCFVHGCLRFVKKELSNNSDVSDLSPWSTIGAGGSAVAPYGNIQRGYAMFFKKYGTRKCIDVPRLSSAVGFLCLCRILPSSAACFMGVEVTLSLFDH